MPASSFCARLRAITWPKSLGPNHLARIAWPESLGGNPGDKDRDGIDHLAIDVTWPIVLLRAPLASPAINRWLRLGNSRIAALARPASATMNRRGPATLPDSPAHPVG